MRFGAIAAVLVALVLTLSLVLPSPAAYAMEQHPHAGLAPPAIHSAQSGISLAKTSDQTQSAAQGDQTFTMNVIFVPGRGILDATSTVPRISVSAFFSDGRVNTSSLSGAGSLPTGNLVVSLSRVGTSSLGTTVTVTSDTSLIGTTVITTASAPDLVLSGTTSLDIGKQPLSTAIGGKLDDSSGLISVAQVGVTALGNGDTVKNGEAGLLAGKATGIATLLALGAFALIAVGGARAATRRR